MSQSPLNSSATAVSSPSFYHNSTKKENLSISLTKFLEAQVYSGITNGVRTLIKSDQKAKPRVLICMSKYCISLMCKSKLHGNDRKASCFSGLFTKGRFTVQLDIFGI